MMCSVVFHFYHHTHVHVAEQGGNGQEYLGNVRTRLELDFSWGLRWKASNFGDSAGSRPLNVRPRHMTACDLGTLRCPPTPTSIH